MLGLGLVLALTISLQTKIGFKLIQFTLFGGLLFLKQKRIKWLSQALFLILTILINILIPEGKVIFTIFAFPITEGALVTGLRRGLNLITLLLMSRCILSEINATDLKLNSFLNDTLCYLNFFQEKKNSFFKTNLFQYLDNLLLKASDIKEMALNKATKPSSFFGIAYSLIAFFSLILLFL